ncbi:predicted protein [Postia placenta Mad-698-R]|uniref:Uncharacterized protein n=1 Tax=Postia placenta MAD-698-R-SB12 TaxID=670580 RepID=A0A1X6MY60_9APHY|nr:hypothetical protein POSPLADRAFT_1047528 [Postia placenta MAD-698-R-SB12]EED81178.1 predicted protein [Postia placenta Mad-698-R]OSX61305.1 hypothetical protein POSPLADRAFT_1047528 [Postia placenta MAD-698-R-SB12]
MSVYLSNKQVPNARSYPECHLHSKFLQAILPYCAALLYKFKKELDEKMRGGQLLVQQAISVHTMPSVPLSVEVEGSDQHRSLSEGSFPWAVLVSLFLPFRTLGRDLLLIAQELRHHDDVLSALSHGTLLVLARTKDWRPNGEIGDEVFVKLPANYDKLKDTAKHPYAIIKLDEDKSCAALGEDERKVHGEAIVPPGYTLAVPMPEFKPFILATLFSVEKIRIHRRPEYLKIIVSAGQMISASFTLASTFGDQRDRYGYAAYGLSVFPYALMSLANAICCALIGEYSSRHVLRTHILQEAERRTDAFFDGAIGRPDPFPGIIPAEGFEKKHLSMKQDGERKLLIMRSLTGMEEQTFILDEQNTQNSSDTSFRVDLTISPLLDGIGPTPDPALSRDTFLPASQQEYAAILVCLLLTMGLPYAVIYGLTRFHDGRSTITERVMMMLWLAANQLSGLGIVFYSAFLRISQDSLKDATSRWDTWRRPMGAAFRWGTWHRLMDAARCNGSAVWKASWRWLKDAPSLKNHFKFRREGNSAKPSDAKPSDWLPRAYVAFLVLPAAGGLIMSTF